MGGTLRRWLKPVEIAAAPATLIGLGITLAVLFDGGGGEKPLEPQSTPEIQPASTNTSSGLLTMVVSNRHWPGYFDVDRSGLAVQQGDTLTYDRDAFTAANRERKLVRPVAFSDEDVFLTDFTVANPSETDTVLITSVGVIVEDYQRPPSSVRPGCIYWPLGGGEEPIAAFRIKLDPTNVGEEIISGIVPTFGHVMRIGYGDLRAFRAIVAVGEPGTYRYSMAVHYDTSYGTSETVISEPVYAMLVPTSTVADFVFPSTVPPEAVRGCGLEAARCTPRPECAR